MLSLLISMAAALPALDTLTPDALNDGVLLRQIRDHYAESAPVYERAAIRSIRIKVM